MFKRVAIVAVMMLGFIVIEAAYPKNEAAAVELLGEKGYRNVVTEKTGRYCGRSQRVYAFRAERSDGSPVSGDLCFTILRWFGSVREAPDHF